jgi:hypothetical protein
MLGVTQLGNLRKEDMEVTLLPLAEATVDMLLP